MGKADVGGAADCGRGTVLGQLVKIITNRVVSQQAFVRRIGETAISQEGAKGAVAWRDRGDERASGRAVRNGGCHGDTKARRTATGKELTTKETMGYAPRRTRASGSLRTFL